MTTDLKYKGVPLELGNIVYTLPALPLKRLKDAAPLMSGTIANDGYVDVLIQAIFWSLQRNYPDIKLTDLEEQIDMLNYQNVVKSFTEANGFVVTGAVTASGEAPASQ